MIMKTGCKCSARLKGSVSSHTPVMRRLGKKPKHAMWKALPSTLRRVFQGHRPAGYMYHSEQDRFCCHNNKPQTSAARNHFLLSLHNHCGSQRRREMEAFFCQSRCLEAQLVAQLSISVLLISNFQTRRRVFQRL